MKLQIKYTNATITANIMGVIVAGIAWCFFIRCQSIKSGTYAGHTNLKESTVSMHGALADILIRNSVVNAIWHNDSEGSSTTPIKRGFHDCTIICN